MAGDTIETPHRPLVPLVVDPDVDGGLGVTWQFLKWLLFFDLASAPILFLIFALIIWSTRPMAKMTVSEATAAKSKLASANCPTALATTLVGCCGLDFINQLIALAAQYLPQFGSFWTLVEEVLALFGGAPVVTGAALPSGFLQNLIAMLVKYGPTILPLILQLLALFGGGTVPPAPTP